MMTRDEAKAILEEEAEYLYQDDKPYNRKAFEMAMQALSQEPCDDAISREALIAKLTELIKTSRSTIEIKAKLIPMIEQLPSVSTTKNIVNHGTMNITL